MEPPRKPPAHRPDEVPEDMPEEFPSDDERGFPEPAEYPERPGGEPDEAEEAPPD